MKISVNLRPGAKRAAARGISLGGLGAGFGGLAARLKTLGATDETGGRDPLFYLAVLAWVGVLGFLGYTFVRTGSQLATLRPQLEETQSEHQRFREFVRQKRREEAVRDSVLGQIATIRAVDGDRYVWAHIMDDVARALPPFTWLSDVRAVPPAADTSGAERLPVEVQITGRTVDIQGYTRFMRQLEDAPWLGNVTAISANTVVEQGRAVTAFVLRATFTAADSSYLRTVPVAESVVR